ncbi:MAG TPA: DNA mismatch repair protein MutS [Candidatus Baltobacteraceae bacterium]|nr:DNA mismatch repair protein MutS [Candidatus Baltobacteraceae bacterium]
MLEQYFEMKAKHPEAVLLSRVGDFYEAYGEDAETIARALQITLTSKEAGGGRRIAMSGVPHHALHTYLAKLVAQRRVVALAEQLEPPIPNKLVRRDVVRVVTPGTVIEEHLLERGLNNYLASVSTCGEAVSVAYADISTGRTAATAFVGETALDEAVTELMRLSPAEIVADLPADVRTVLERQMPGTRVSAPPIALVGAVDASARGSFSMEESRVVGRSLAVLDDFVRRVGLANAGPVLRTPEYYQSGTHLMIDANARKHLELTKALGGNSKATLLATIDRSRTAMGSRLLARRLLAPSLDRALIQQRQEHLEILIGDYAARASLQSLLDNVYDLERLSQKVRYRRAGPRDLSALQRTLTLLAPLRAALPPLLEPLGATFGEHGELIALLERTLLDDPPATLVDGGVIRPDASAELAECVALRTQARERISALEERERARTGIKSLKVKYASAFGYSIEISNSNRSSIPADYVRKQTLTNGERFITPELKELEQAISSAQTRQLRLEEAVFQDLVEQVAGRVERLLTTADALAELDVFCGLAEIASERGYVRPVLIDGRRLEILDGRHPVVEMLVGNEFVPNDLHLGEELTRFMVLTGPNMGGKSTFLRQAALLVILAQIGSFVPARSMTLSVIDRIFTRIGAGDDLASGQSTFYVEMAEAASILRRCTSRSLLLIDELGRGTSTVDGLAIAQAICEYLLGLERQMPMVMFATHFHELVALDERWKALGNFHVTAVENTVTSGAPVFSHRVLPGSTSRSFGIDVARMAGLPSGVVSRAKEIASALDERPTLSERVPLRAPLAAPNQREETQLTLGLEQKELKRSHLLN